MKFLAWWSRLKEAKNAKQRRQRLAGHRKKFFAQFNIWEHAKKTTDIVKYCARFSRIEDIDRRFWETQKYSLRFVCGPHTEGGYPETRCSSRKGYDDDIYYDALYNIVLCHEEKPIALLSFEVSDEVVLIKQLQGLTILMQDRQPIAWTNEKLEQLRWERMLVMITEDMIRGLGFEELQIQKAKNNRWINRQYNVDRFERLYMRYDIAAKRMGFREDHEKDCWVLPLITAR